ncbi:grainyhead-like protein 1 homolog isoform X1 [Centruroides vittatus]|uniref:grainyhead-like protein 1 homolog isoform X1 n=2 Tax=Centruroides vittatus TaxID=120091 RepID=UPI00350FD8B7
MEVEKTGLSSLAGSTTKPPSQDVGKPKTGCSSSTSTGPDDTTSKEKCLTEEFDQSDKEKPQRMTDMPEGDDGWRAYYEHPLTAATTAMLNINGAGEEQNPGMGLLFEYYKLNPIEKQEKVAPLPSIWSTAIPSTATNTISATVAQTSVSGITTSSPTTTENTPVLYLRTETEDQSEKQSTKEENTENSPEMRTSPTANSEGGEETENSPITIIVKQEPILESNPTSPNRTEIKSEPFLNSPSQTPIDLVTSPLAPTAVAVTTPTSTPNISEEDVAKSSGNVISLGAASTSQPYTQVFANVTSSQPAYETLGLAQYSVLTNAVAISASPPPQYGNQNSTSSRTVYAVTTGDYYRDYYQTDQYQAVRQQLGSYAENNELVDRYIRQNGTYKTSLHGLTVDLPSPDSGIGDTTITPRDSLPQIFDYSDLSQTSALLQSTDQQTTSRPSSSQSQSSRRSWHDYGRNSESDKVQIPKLHSEFGFRYYLEAPISTSQRREDDRITYINKGQFYGITLEYVPDPERPVGLKSTTVKSMVMLIFREEKSAEEELKAWQFWHSRQHSVKQRILDADTKNSSGIVGQIEEITHNAIAFFWNPLEGPAKINVAVQCLSTDFSNQKGVKGLPLHLQIDTVDDYREESLPIHRGYCQIKVFCDKGAERKTRDEERRAAKRKMTASGSSRKKIEEMYHPPCDRSEFYSMSDLLKPPLLFTPSEDLDKVGIIKVHTVETNFYSTQSAVTEEAPAAIIDRRDVSDTRQSNEVTFPIPIKRVKMYPTDRVLLYARRENEDIYHPLHLVPPNLAGLATAIENKYLISAKNIRNIYKRCKKGITVQMDDEIIKHYFNEDTFLIEVSKIDDCYDITLVEL